MERTLVRHQYAGLSRADKGLVRQYVARMTGLSRAQVTRLIASYAANGSGEGGDVSAAQVRRALHESRRGTAGLCRPGARQLERSGDANASCSASISEYGQAAYQRLAQISVAQIYRFRNSASLSQTQHQLSADTAHADPHRRAPQAAIRTDGPATCASTRCIKAIRTASRVCITSTRSTK